MSSDTHRCVANLTSRFRLKKYPLANGNVKTYLTARELESLQCLAQGFTCKEIGNILGITDRTIQTHLEHVKNKLGVCSRGQLLKIYHSSSLAKLS